MAHPNQIRGLGPSSYTVMGIDIYEKKMGIPVWGWGAIVAAVGYYFFKKK